MTKQIVTGILSYGMSGRVFHAPFIHTHPEFQLYAVVERSVKKAVERYPNVISYDNVVQLVDDPQVELIIVNTPNYLHYEHTKLALEAGKHVLVEKPFAATPEQAKELFELGKKNNCKVMVYQNRRWDSDFQTVKKIVQDGVLGNLIECHFRFDRYRKEISVKKFKEEPFPASGLSFDLGPHLLDQVISLFGKPLAWAKTTGTYRPDSKVDDYLHVHLQYPQEVNVFVTASLQTVKPLPSFVLHGTKGTFTKQRTDVQEEQLEKAILPTDWEYGIEPDGAEGVLSLMTGEGIETQHFTALKGNYVRLFDAVYECIRLNEEFPIKEDEIIIQLEILAS